MLMRKQAQLRNKDFLVYQSSCNGPLTQSKALPELFFRLLKSSTTQDAHPIPSGHSTTEARYKQMQDTRLKAVKVKIF